MCGGPCDHHRVYLRDDRPSRLADRLGDDSFQVIPDDMVATQFQRQEVVWHGNI